MDWKFTDWVCPFVPALKSGAAKRVSTRRPSADRNPATSAFSWVLFAPKWSPLVARTFRLPPDTAALAGFSSGGVALLLSSAPVSPFWNGVPAVLKSNVTVSPAASARP